MFLQIFYANPGAGAALKITAPTPVKFGGSGSTILIVILCIKSNNKTSEKVEKRNYFIKVIILINWNVNKQNPALLFPTNWPSVLNFWGKVILAITTDLIEVSF